MNSAGPRESFWARRVRGPLLALLTQGLSPDKLALTLAVGTACSLFPFLGFTSLLNLGVGLRLRLNQPLLQTLNQVLGPVQILLILVYVRGGEWLWRAQASHFTVTEIIRTFREDGPAAFLQRFGVAGGHALTCWAVTSPFLLAAVYFSTRPLLHRLASNSVRRA